MESVYKRNNSYVVIYYYTDIRMKREFANRNENLAKHSKMRSNEN